ncbi:MAG: Gfo/Idh/MocA family protein [Gammaproteobacteria bacterium]
MGGNTAGRDPIGVAVVGIGGWGKNLARNFAEIAHAHLKYVCDLDEKRRVDFASRYPRVTPVADFEVVLKDPDVRGVVIATTAPRHFELARMALEAGKDVFVEKPLVLNSADARELIGLAETRGRLLMVGHLLEYHPVVNRLKEMVAGEELGKLHYVYAQRLNLGTVRGDENAMWNFAPHDISSILYVLGREPTDVAARGQCYLQKGIEDIVFLTLNFGDEMLAHIHVSWLDPHKIRRLTFVGNRKMAVFDDLEPTEKLKIYDKGAQVNPDYGSYAEYVSLRFGDITMPYIKMSEPLRIECLHFLDCIRERKAPVSDGYDGLRVVQVLEAAQESLLQNGRPVRLDQEMRRFGKPVI